MVANTTLSQIKDLNKPKLIIGEGIDERNFLQAFIRFLSIDDVEAEEYSNPS
ncbi:hypothetical protein XM38_026470 [Halomicronema hongdechloris C2206]|uniref:Uncharacterized protein n=1 Tax=Halomicronema hongdechloris C2206 TaxID=1641165 RepID=A0A1Z3HN03_9CYAN|nr:hypothetical protein [Halomicronema hongdechloris]ASC71693.1 hypothetical protein XM38_026470 [Halomicronema hongdechloris C2206]